MEGRGVWRVLVALAVLVCSLVLPMGTAQGASTRATVCLPFTATGEGQDLGAGRTTATISVGDYRIGSTEAAFTITGVTGTIASFEGPLTFQPDGVRGTLIAQLGGTVDVATGRFSATSTSVSGTQRLTRVTGDVQIEGVQDLSSGAFTETLTGRICIAGGR
jgi:hypothetical protein